MYNTREIENNITFDKILSLVNDYFIYCYYLGREIKINKPTHSPLRKDNNPSWAIYRNKKGILKYKDFATGESGNAVTLVQELYKLKYGEALRKIWQDLVVKKPTNILSSNLKENNTTRKDSIIQIKKKNFIDQDIKFWKQYNISKDTLKLYKVFPIQTFWVNEIQGFVYTNKEPMYAYSIYDKFKIYRPYSKKADKWRNNCSGYDIQGLEQLKDKGNLLIITKSMKDVMVLYELGYSAIAPQSEAVAIPKIILDHLRLRFKNIIVLYDNDEGGIQGATKLSERYSIPYIYIPKQYLDIYNVKDISDFIKSFGKKETLKILKELLNEPNRK